MFSPLTISLKYLAYLLNSSNGRGHGVHSPFVFDFIRNVLNDRTAYPEYKLVEGLRKKLLADNTPVPFKEFGAGTKTPGLSRSVSSIARGSAKNAKYGQLLFRIVRRYQPHYVLELGTSLGISTAYLAAADKSSVVISGEGNDSVAALARSNLGSLQLDNARVVTGNFDNTLPEMISQLPHVDLAFVDGNHRRQPTLNYFRELLKKTGPGSIIIFDDIHWSRGMEMAWTEVRQHESVTLSIDLFFLGIIFFRPEFRTSQHFRIRF
jgi:predicted O-methyltransferase YrrM